MSLKMHMNHGWTRMDTDGEHRAAPQTFWTAVAERSADTAFASRGAESRRIPKPLRGTGKRRGAPLPAAVQKHSATLPPRCASSLKQVLLTCVAVVFLTAQPSAAAPTPAQVEFFEKSIRPVLAAECYECHSSAKKKGGLALDTRDVLLKGGESGPTIVPGQPDSSLLLQALRHTHPTLKMPKNGAKLDVRIVANFAEWIRQGAPDPRTSPATAGAQPTSSTWADTLAFRRQWWSFQPLAKTTVPAPKNAAWSTNAIDRFLLAKMESHGLTPGPDADPRTLIRRITFALTGLPPKPADVEAFVKECESPIANRQSAIANATDRLLASPAFAEHWARHWMDLVRYAETHGSEGDPEIPLMWRYRDYLIRAFAANVPADQLIREHIAGDLLSPAQTRWNKSDALNESRLGLAHFRLVEHGFQPVDTLDDQVKAVDSQIDVLAKAFQGLTVSCARCHDHKFDPISQRDYYALYGVLAAARPAQIQLDSPEVLNKHRAELLALKAQIKSALADSWRDAIPQLIAQLTRGSSADPQLAALTQRITETEQALAAIETDARAKALNTRAGGLQPPTAAPTPSAAPKPSTSPSPSPQPSPSGRGSDVSSAGPKPAATEPRSATVVPSLSPGERAGVRGKGSSEAPPRVPSPISRWSFDTDARDQAGSLHGELLGGATIRNGRLILDGKEAHFRTPPLSRDLREKTLEAWITLATLDQQGGGVLTVETSNGSVFDAIVFGEKSPKKWVNGSNNFRRSQLLDGAVESAKPGELVHLAVVYRADNSIAFYRNGALYAPAFTPTGEDSALRTFAAGASRVLLGRRHTGGGRAFLAGEIDEARLYDRALTTEQVAASFQAGTVGVTAEEIATAMTPEQKARHATLTAELKAARAELAAKAPSATEDSLAAALKDAQSNVANPLHAWVKLGKLDGAAFATGWADVTKTWRDQLAIAQEHNAQFKTEWDFAKGDGAKWFTDGNAFPGAPVSDPALTRSNLQRAGSETGAPQIGDFTLEPAGERVLKGLLPAAVSSHLLSEKHGGLLTSPRFRITTDSISVRAAGGKGAMVRVIVDNYPLGSNPIFPKAELTRDEPGWVRMDTAYRKGNWAYIEFGTADDLTRKLGKSSDASGRSWFSVERVVFHDKETLREVPLAPAPLLAGAGGLQPTRNNPLQPKSAAELATVYSETLMSTLRAWREGKLSEEQRAFLDFFLRRSLLPASPNALPKVAPLVAEYRRLEGEIAAPRRAPGVIEGTVFDSPMLARGDHTKPGELVPRGYLEVLGVKEDAKRSDGVVEQRIVAGTNLKPITPSLHHSTTPSASPARLALAEAMASLQNPLTARVMVNRVWHHLFGRGLVPTVDNFGRLGDQPTHPELLDHLAAQFMAEGWSFKRLIRELVMTRAYQLASEPTVAARERDAANDFLSHFRVRRLEAEAIRDSLLVVSGRLDATQFGVPVSTGDRARRSIYLSIRRNNLSPFLEIFDAPKPFTTLGRRDATNVPAQSLALLNDLFVIDLARQWAVAAIAAEPSVDRRVGRMFGEAFARSPTADESAKAVAYLSELAGEAKIAPEQLATSERVWQDFAQSLFNLKEFIYVR